MKPFDLIFLNLRPLMTGLIRGAEFAEIFSPCFRELFSVSDQPAIDHQSHLVSGTSSAFPGRSHQKNFWRLNNKTFALFVNGSLGQLENLLNYR